MGGFMNIYEMKKRREEIAAMREDISSDVHSVKTEIQRLIDITENAEEILDIA